MRSDEKHPALLVVALLVQQSMGSLTFPIAKLGLAAIEPFTFAFYRYAISSLVLLLIVGRMRHSAPIVRRDRWQIVGLGLLVILFNQTAYLLGQSLTTASHGALLFATTPIWICLLAVLHLKERIGWRRGCGIVLALGGVAIIMSSSAAGMGAGSLEGDAIILLAVLAWAYYTVLGRPLVRRYGALRVTAYALASGSACYAPFGAYRALTHDYAGATPGAWLSIVYVALGTSVVTYLLWYWVLKYMEASRVAVYHNLQPVIATAVAHVFLDEALGVTFVIGGLVVLSGVVTTELQTRGRPADPVAGGTYSPRERRPGGPDEST